MTSKKDIEYGVMIASIGTTDTEKTVSKQTFFRLLAEQYPYSAGWRVVERETIYVNGEIVMSYHMENKPVDG